MRHALSLTLLLAVSPLALAQPDAEFGTVQAESVRIADEAPTTSDDSRAATGPLLEITKRGSGGEELVLRRTGTTNQNNEWRFAITGNSPNLPGVAPGSFVLTSQQASRDIVLRSQATTSAITPSVPFVVKANGNVGIGTGSPGLKLEVNGGNIGQLQAGSFGSTAFGNQWIATGLSPFPPNGVNNPYGIRVQDDSDFALFQLVERGGLPTRPPTGKKDAEIAWGNDKDDRLNVVFIDDQNTRTLVAQFTVDGPSQDAIAEGAAPAGTFTVQGEIATDVLELRGGSDIAEPFAIADSPVLAPGMVVAIDPDAPGALRVADRAYDRTVAGIVSGAGGIRPGLTLRQDGTVADGDHPVALTGRVYAYADASAGPIRPGDLLTTSDTPGHAMRATDADRAQGAVLGKAMTALDEGTGLVLVLVSLQ